jgi:(1->4)-alpha-D-glucan 1-alpha-D-glucosylmutase
MDEAAYNVFKQRIKEYMLKASREAKDNTSWINPNTMYEDSLMIFIEKILDNNTSNDFLDDLKKFQKRIASYGIYNSLSQMLLKITSPGVPDFYQGTELWDLSQVDPDNRRPVDYSLRMQMLTEMIDREKEIGILQLSRELTQRREDGRVKLFLIYKALNHRKGNRSLFEKGEYLPLEVLGGRENHVCTFARRLGNMTAIIAVPRFLTSIVPDVNSLPLGNEVWHDSAVVLPFDKEGVQYYNIVTGETVTTSKIRGAVALYLSDIFQHFPVALFDKIVQTGTGDKVLNRR